MYIVVGVALAVRYDIERGKGDHCHHGDKESAYAFTTVEKLIQDFRSDIEQLRGEQRE